MSTAPAFLPPPEQLALCGLTGDDFRRLFLDLLPQGYAWSKWRGTVIYAVFDGAGQEPARVAGRDCDLLEESWPCGSTELLPDWERVCGLPDECTAGTAWPLATRRAFVCAKLAEQGGASPAYFIALAASYGFTITIEEHYPWRMGCTSFCDVTVGIPWFWWEVICPDLPVTHLTMGCWQLGQPLCVIQGAAVLECVIRRAAPAHTLVTFRYVITKGAWNTGEWDREAWS
jgi:uncharacterized protein YmfQ (DUF2313 family)